MNRTGEGLIERINRSYSDSIRSTCEPLYVQKTGTVTANDHCVHFECVA